MLLRCIGLKLALLRLVGPTECPVCAKTDRALPFGLHGIGETNLIRPLVQCGL